MSRRDAITYSFIESDRIWPPFIAHDLSHPFMKALLEVLTRLPDDEYYIVESYVSFIVEVKEIMAANAPFVRTYFPGPGKIEVRFDTIVFFHTALGYSHKALVAIIAHELAHSIESHPDYKTDEQMADLMVHSWGFQEELESLRIETEKLKP
jgi:hypothetical protein